MADDISVGQYYQSKALQEDAQRWRDSMSSNALVRQYGPSYANPQMAQQAASAQQTGVLTQGEQQRQNFLAESHPIAIEHAKQQNVLGGQAIAQGELAGEQNKGAAQRQAVYAMHDGLTEALDKGVDPEKAFDAMAEAAAPALGTTKEKLSASYREQFVKDPRGTLAKLKAVIPAAEYGTMNPTQRIAAQAASRAGDKTSIEMEKAKQDMHQEFFKTLGVKSVDDAEQRVASLQAYQSRLGTPANVKTGAPATGIISDIDKALAQIDKLPKSALARTASSYFSGTAAKDFEQMIKQISDNSGLMDAAIQKGQGVNLPRSTAAMESAAHAFINVTPGSSLGRLKEQLEKIKSATTVIAQDVAKEGENAQVTYAKAKQYSDTKITPPNPATVTPNPSLQSPFARPGQVPPAQAAPAQSPPPPGIPTGTGTVTMPTQQPNTGANASQVPGAAPLPGGGSTVVNPPRPNTRVMSNKELLDLYLPKGR